MFLYLGVKNRLEKSPTPKKYIETPLLVVWRNTKSSKDFNFTITKDISKEDTISLNDVKTNCNLNNALNKSIYRVLLKNKDISWRYFSEIFQSESEKTTKRLFYYDYSRNYTLTKTGSILVLEHKIHIFPPAMESTLSCYKTYFLQ